MARRQAPSYDRWAQYIESEGAMHVEANGFINLQLSWDKTENKRVVSPSHYVVMWSSREKSGKLRYTSSLLSLRLIEEEKLPKEVEVAIEVRGRDGETTSCGGQYIEFELLAQLSDLPKQTPLAIVAGPVRVNAETELREFMRIDMGRCLREIVSDVIDDPAGKQRGQLSRRRWYICVEVMRLICGANSLDCSALDKSDVPPLEWVLCLSDERVAQAVCPEMAHLQDKSIDELTRFIDGGSKKGKAKKKKKEERPEPTRPVFPEGTRWQLPLGWMDQEDMAKHLRCWKDLAQCELTQVIEGNRYLQLRLRPDGTRLRSTPASCVLAFPRHEAVKRMSDNEMLGATNVPFFSTLLNIFVFSNDELRDPGKEFRCPPTEVSKGNLVFELMVRQRDCPTPPPLRFSSGPCNPNSRVDMSRTVQWTEPELVQLRVDGREEPVIRMRWWVNIEVLQMVCKSNSIDCSGLEGESFVPFEWLCCVYDDGFPGAPALQERNWAFRDETGYPKGPAPKAPEEEAELSSGSSSRTLALPAKLVDFWCQLVKKELPYIAKADCYVHFDVRMGSAGRQVAPEHWIVAFANGKARYHTGLLSIQVVPETSVPEGYEALPQEIDPHSQGPKDYLLFELFLRPSDAAPPLRITAGPVRENPTTKHRESMRIDLGRSVRQIRKDVVEQNGKRLNRSSWYICLETLRLVAGCNSLDCSGLDDPKAPPVSWVIVLCDEQFEPQARERSIEDLLDFIDGKADDALRELKEDGAKKGKIKREKEPPADGERVKATAVALFDLMSSLSEERGRAGAASAAAAAAAASGDPVAQVKAAAELLAQAAAQSNSPRKYAAALEAAQLAAEPPQPSSSSRTRFPQKPKAKAQAKSSSRETNSETEESLSPDESNLSASKALAASLSSRRSETAGAASASFRDGLLRVSGIDAAGLDLQGLLLSGLREGLAQVPLSLPKEEPAPASASASNEPRRRKRR